MSDQILVFCDNCGVETKLENAKFEMAPGSFQAGFEFDTKPDEYETVLCSKCYSTYLEKRERSSYSEPDIDLDAFSKE